MSFAEISKPISLNQNGRKDNQTRARTDRSQVSESNGPNTKDLNLFMNLIAEDNMTESGPIQEPNRDANGVMSLFMDSSDPSLYGHSKETAAAGEIIAESNPDRHISDNGLPLTRISTNNDTDAVARRESLENYTIGYNKKTHTNLSRSRKGNSLIEDGNTDAPNTDDDHGSIVIAGANSPDNDTPLGYGRQENLFTVEKSKKRAHSTGSNAQGAFVDQVDSAARHDDRYFSESEHLLTDSGPLPLIDPESEVLSDLLPQGAQFQQEVSVTDRATSQHIPPGLQDWHIFWSSTSIGTTLQKNLFHTDGGRQFRSTEPASG